MDLDSDWCQNIRRQTAAGKYVGRVRIVDTPPTEGQLFLLNYARCNAATGEDARNVWRAADRPQPPTTCRRGPKASVSRRHSRN
ncbi:DUF6879 family protein [Streptomyces sp. NPDC014744]|uniref:DUF6879 family protein n=1 Tax=Streptomyces sp. NPDC014744 TaxID=3364903 RepID=UPI0036FE96D2